MSIGSLEGVHGKSPNARKEKSTVSDSFYRPFLIFSLISFSKRAQSPLEIMVDRKMLL